MSPDRRALFHPGSRAIRRLVPCLLLAALLGPAGRAGAEEEKRPAPGGWHALLVGCTEYPVLRERLGKEKYDAARIALVGPANDVVLMRRTLLEVFGVAPDRIKALAGWPEEAAQRPTHDNIIGELDRLAKAVKRGDRVLIHMAGHGSQAPDTSGDELDALDEIFLPADVAGWDRQAGKVAGSITDDVLGAKVRAIRDAGAMVWLLMDCCHSGTMVRGGGQGLRMRRLDPEYLGVPPTTTRGAGAEEDEPLPERELGDDQNLGAIVAMYAAQSYKLAPEMPLPRSGPREETRPHGLFTYMVVSQLRRS
ncbi:MAG: caspase family protein, partial [Planctomycetota bacterium]